MIDAGVTTGNITGMMYLGRFDQAGRPLALFRASASLIEQLRSDGTWVEVGRPDDAGELEVLRPDEASLVALILDVPGAVTVAA